MGHFLRCALSSRMTKLLVEPLRNESLKDLNQFTRLFATRDSIDHEEPKSKKTSIDENYLADLHKFSKEDTINLPRSNVRQEDYDLAPSNDENTFGTFAKSNPYILLIDKLFEDDTEEIQYMSELPNYLPQVEYARMIKKYLKQRRFADALDVLQVTMLKEHRVKPEYYIYSILIAHCGLTGYTKMAFKLYNDMKKRGLPVKASVYTSLFNSCSNSPFPSDGLIRTRKLFTSMNENNILPNQITCHAIIKAFARCGSVEEAFKVVDYMMSRKMEIKAETMSFAFHACISDKEAGFRHALLVYRKMNEYQIKPDVIHFNLFLHCLRDCSIGDLDSTIDVLKRLGVENADQLSVRKDHQPLLTDGYPWEEEANFSHQIVAGINRDSQLQQHSGETTQKNTSENLLPNLFLKSPTLGCIVSLSEIVTRQDRLFLLGGCDGFLKEMSRKNVEPDIKTISLLLECIPDTCAAENNFLHLIGKLKLKPDLLFFNTLIKRRAHRKQYHEAKEILSKLTVYGFQPDMMTYTNLAMTCERRLDACELLKAIEDSGFRPNIESVTSLLGNAAKNFQMNYVDLILKVIDYEEMKVNQRFMDKLEKFYQSCLHALKTRSDRFTPSHKDAMKNFCKLYPQWKEKVEKEEQTHPWQHLRQRQPESETNDEFLNQHVEGHAPKSKFPRLGPNTVPKVRKAKLRGLKEENPEMFQKNLQKGSIVQRLKGLSSVQYQQIVTSESNNK